MTKVVKKRVPRMVEIVDITSTPVSKEESPQKVVVTPSSPPATRRSHSSPVRFLRRAGRALSPRRAGRSLSPSRRRKDKQPERLGIEQSPFQDDTAPDDSSTQQSNSSHRLGIQRGTYDQEPHYGINLITPVSMQEEKKDGEENEIVFENNTPETPSLFRNAWNKNPLFPPSSPSSKKAKSDRCETPEKTIHKSTAAGHYLTANAQTPSPVHGLRYSIDKGTKAMNRQERVKSREAALRKVRRVKESKVTWTKDLPDDDKKKKKKSSFKVFLLLLQPDAKIFELIQLLYPPETTKVGDILDMIPKNATEPALGAQKYIGLTRPKKKSKPFTDLSLLASNDSVTNRAGIEQGEILVAIPHGFAPRLMIRLSKQILANDRIQKLLEQSDPLRKKNKRSSRRSSSSNKVMTMESVAEDPAEEEAPPARTQDEEPSPIKRAKTQAQVANAQVEEKTSRVNASPSKRIEDLVSPRSVSTPRSVRRLSPDNAEAATPKSSGSRRRQALGGNYEDESVDMASSFSSWSQSFDSSWMSRYSFATTGNFSTEASVGSNRSVRLRRQRRLKLMTNFKRSAIALVVIMSVFYYIDPNGYAARGKMIQTDNPMGLFGSASFVFALLALVKLQRFLQKPVGTVSESKCPFLKISSTVLGHLTKHQAVANGHE